MPADGDSTHLLGRQDADALIGVLAVLEGHLVAGDLDPRVIDRLSRRLVGPGAGAAELRVALGNLNQRLRYALGEYDEAPGPDTGAVDQYFGFISEADAETFAEAVRAQHKTTGPPVPVDGRGYDDGAVRWQVAVRSTTLPLSAAFDAESGRLLALAAEHGGHDGGWGSPPPDVRP